MAKILLKKIWIMRNLIILTHGRLFCRNLCARSGAKVCKSYRSRQELSHDYLLTKIGFDTAENEPLKFLEVIQFTYSFAS